MRKTFWVALILFVVTFAHADSVCQNAKVTGTFSTLEYNYEGGDLIGYEIRIMLGDRYYALVQVADGEPRAPIMAPIDIEVGKCTFRINMPKNADGIDDIHGVINPNSMTARFQFSGGNSDLVTIKRKPSYWD